MFSYEINHYNLAKNFKLPSHRAPQQSLFPKLILIQSSVHAAGG